LRIADFRFRTAGVQQSAIYNLKSEMK